MKVTFECYYKDLPGAKNAMVNLRDVLLVPAATDSFFSLKVMDVEGNKIVSLKFLIRAKLKSLLGSPASEEMKWKEILRNTASLTQMVIHFSEGVDNLVLHPGILDRRT